MGNASSKTVPSKKLKRRKRSKAEIGDSKVARFNAFGQLEWLDRSSVTECIETEERYNEELDRFLEDVARASKRSKKKS